MRRGFIFSFTIDLIIMLILMVLMWMVVGLSFDSIVETKENELDQILIDYESISSTFVLINTEGSHPEKVYTCDLSTMSSVDTNNPGSCPSDLRGVRYGNKLRGIKK